MNIFSETCFLEAFSRAYFPDRNLTPHLFELENRLWRLPAINDSKFISGLQFIDFFEPLDKQSLTSEFASSQICYLPRVSHGIISSAEWLEQKLDRYFEASPTIFWSNFQSWDDFINYVGQNRSRLFLDSRRRHRKLEKNLGSPQFIVDDRKAGVLETCLRWKSEQLLRKGLPDRFADPRHLHLFRELAARQILLVSSLEVKDCLLAVHISMLHKGRLYWWVTAYDPAYSQYSPGRLLLHFLLEESFKQGHTEFDFLRGNEDYKWYYATHVRLIKDIGQRPFSKQLEYSMKSILYNFPNIKTALKKIYHKVLI